MKNITKSIRCGFTLVEMLVVLLIFSIVGILATRSIAVSLRNSRKSESISQARENIGYVLKIMERQIRNADSITIPCASSELNYVDGNGDPSSFECSGGSIFLNSQRLTNENIVIDCSGVFACNDGTADVPPSVDINLNAETQDLQGAEGFVISSSTKILLRTY